MGGGGDPKEGSLKLFEKLTKGFLEVTVVLKVSKDR